MTRTKITPESMSDIVTTCSICRPVQLKHHDFDASPTYKFVTYTMTKVIGSLLLDTVSIY